MKFEKENILKMISNLGFNNEIIIKSLGSSPELLDSFVEYAISQEELAWRATWILSHYSKKNNRALQKYSSIFIMSLNNIKVDGQLREALKIICNLELSEKQKSEVYDICLGLFKNNRRQSSVRMIAFNFLFKIAKEYPELNNEIFIIFESIKEYLSQGIRKSIAHKLEKVKQSNF